MNMESWRELGNPRDVSRIFAGLDYAGWRRLRRSDDSRYLGLVLPRFLGRLPWSVRARPGEAAEFAFEEKSEGRGPEGYVWSNAAFAFGMCLARAFRLHGWCARIRGAESGGLLDNLPCDFFPTDTGDVDLRCPTEISITHRREAELARCGLMPLSHWKGSGAAVFVGAQSLQQPETYEDADATVNASLSSRLPYLFAVCRFAHYLKVMVRDKTGRDMSREEVERYLHNWIMGYVSDDATASEERKCEAPLRKAHVEVQDDLENPGRYRAVFWLRPHFQLEGLTVSLRLLSRLPPQG
jgi:type VI secretion system protein ImpC